MPRPAHAGAEALPPDHWVYEELEHFEARGLLHLHGCRPYSRSEVRLWVETLAARADSGEAVLGRVEIQRLRRLADEFVRGGDLEDAGRRFDPPLLRGGEAGWAFAGDADLRAGGAGRDGGAGDAWGTAHLETVLDFRSWIAYETRYRLSLDSDAEELPGRPLSSRQRNWRGLVSENDRAYVAAERGPLRLRLGRDFTAWGPRRGQELLVSASGQSLDALELQVHLRRFRLTSVTALLSGGRGRRYAAHRLEADLGPLHLGVQEAVVYASSSFEPAYLFPISFYYGNQFNERADDNVLVGADLKWVSRLGVLQGELLVDDAIYDGDPAPQKLGFGLGLRRAVALGGTDLDLALGYVRLNRWVYTHRQGTNYYVAGSGDPKRGDPFLGNALGPDADRLQAEMDWSPSGRWMLWLQASRTRRGAGNLDLVDWQRGTPYELPFPSGVVRHENHGEFGARARLSRSTEMRAAAAFGSAPGGRQMRLQGELRLDL